MYYNPYIYFLSFCFVIAISVMALSIWMLYYRSVETIEENAYNYIHESMIYADNNLNIMIQDALNISVVMATSDKIINACVEMFIIPQVTVPMITAGASMFFRIAPGIQWKGNG